MKNTNIHVLKALENFLNILIQNKAEIQATTKDHLHLPFVFEVNSGICVNLVNFIDIDRSITEPIINADVTTAKVFAVMNGYFLRWSKFSGSTTFPIKLKEKRESSCYVNLPKWVGEYGDLRWELVDHLLNCIHEEYEEISNG